jgi:hypothetical protein
MGCVPARLGFGWRSLCTPGCTNLRLGTLLHSRTNANDESRIRCSPARPNTEYKRKMESVAHPLILGEHKANIKSQDLQVFQVCEFVQV